VLSFTTDRPVPVICTREYRLGVRPANAGKKYPAEIYTAAEIDRLMARLGRGHAGARNRAAVAMMHRCGLRIAEALALLPKDVDLDQAMVQVLHGKFDQRRVLGIDQQTIALLEIWLRHRQELGISRARPLFCVVSRPNYGKAMHASVLRESIQAAAVKAGIEKRVHPHGLRHTFAVELKREEVPVDEIMVALGHNDLGTTQRYLNHLEPLHVVRMMQARGAHELTPPPSLRAAA